jgi:glycerol-3-phosphate acyltransferase PlsY
VPFGYWRMENVVLLLLSGIAGYLIGAFPSGVVVARGWGAPDVRWAGSGHIGTTNAYRQAGMAAAVLVALVDLFKGVAAVSLGLALTGDPWALPVAGAAAVIGHCWSVYIGFRGGMGLATAGGIFLWLFPFGPIVFVILWLIARALLHHTARAVMVGLVLGTPITLLLWRPAPPVIAFTLAAVTVLLVRHLADFHREYNL